MIFLPYWTESKWCESCRIDYCFFIHLHQYSLRFASGKAFVSSGWISLSPQFWRLSANKSPADFLRILIYRMVAEILIQWEHLEISSGGVAILLWLLPDLSHILIYRLTLMWGMSRYINQGATGQLLYDWDVTKKKMCPLSKPRHIWQGIFFISLCQSDPTVIKNTSNSSSDIKIWVRTQKNNLCNFSVFEHIICMTTNNFSC